MGRRKAGFRRFHKHNESVSWFLQKTKQTMQSLIFVQADDNAQKERKPYLDIVKENDKFIEYYKVIKIIYTAHCVLSLDCTFQTQKVCPENEWDSFISSLKTDLPATFRITGSKGEAQRMLEIIQGQFIQDCLNQNTGEGSEQASIFPLPW